MELYVDQWFHPVVLLHFCIQILYILCRCCAGSMKWVAFGRWSWVANFYITERVSCTKHPTATVHSYRYSHIIILQSNVERERDISSCHCRYSFNHSTPQQDSENHIADMAGPCTCAIREYIVQCDWYGSRTKFASLNLSLSTPFGNLFPIHLIYIWDSELHI